MSNSSIVETNTENQAAKDEPFANGWFTLAVANDGSSALIKKIVRHSGQGTPITAEAILKKLKREKVIYGIDINGIKELVQLIDNNEIPDEFVTVAKGDFQHGDNGIIEWCVEGFDEDKSEVLVVPDMQIAVLKKATKGVPGKNIFGKHKQASAGFDLQLDASAGVITNKEKNGDVIYHATYIGVLKYHSNKVLVDSPLIVTDDRLQAHMDIPVGTVGENGIKTTEDDILKTLDAAGIKHGVNKGNIKSTFENAKESDQIIENVLVAEGTAPIKGDDGVLQWHMEVATQDPSLIKVLPGQLIAVRTLATAAKAGIDVFNKEIPGENGAECSLTIGSGVCEIELENLLEYRAQWLGEVHYDANTLSVRSNIEVSEDKMAVHMKLFHASLAEGDDTVLLEHVLKSLLEHGISYGIQEKNIISALEQKTNELVVAEGKAVVNGDDAKIDWHLDVGATEVNRRAVLPKQLIAIRIPPTAPQSGTNVFAEELPGQKGAIKPLECGEGVVVAEIGGQYEYRARWLGIVQNDSDMVTVDSNLKISADNMTVTMDLFIPATDLGQAEVSLEHVQTALVEQNIRFGIMKEQIKATLEQARINQERHIKMTIAEGRPAKHGVNAELVLDQKLTAGKLLANGKIDFYERDYPWNVKAKDIIGRLIPAQPEQNGMNVLGEPIPATPVVETKLELENIKKGIDGKLHAVQDGVLLINGFNLKVSEILVINGNICPETGNIHTDSTVQVNGFIEPGFVVEAKGDAIVQENVEDAMVRTTGSVLIKAGIRGSHSEIEAQGNITTTFAENAKLKAKGDIIVKNSIISCETVCQKTITIGTPHSKKSTLIGGYTRAVKGVVAANLGSDGCHKTEIEAGLGPDFMQRFKQQLEELETKKASLDALERIYAHYQKKPNLAQEELLQKVIKTREAMKKVYDELLLENESLLSQREEAKKAKVVVHQHVHPGVVIHILDKTYEVTELRKSGTFRLDGEHIIFDSGAS